MCQYSLRFSMFLLSFLICHVACYKYELTGEIVIGLKLEELLTYVKLPNLTKIQNSPMVIRFDEELMDLTEQWYRKIIIQPDSTAYTRHIAVGEENFCCDDFGICSPDVSCVVNVGRSKRSIFGLFGRFFTRVFRRGVPRYSSLRPLSISSVNSWRPAGVVTSRLSKLKGVWKMTQSAATYGMLGFTIYDSINTNMKFSELYSGFAAMKEFESTVLSRFNNETLIDLQQTLEIAQLAKAVRENKQLVTSYYENLELMLPKLTRLLTDYQLCLASLSKQLVCDSLITRDMIMKIFSLKHPNSVKFFYDDALLEEYLRVIPSGIYLADRVMILKIEFIIPTLDYITGKVYTRIGTHNSVDPCSNSPEYLYEIKGELVEMYGTEMCPKLQQTLYCFGGIEFKTTKTSTCWEGAISSGRVKRGIIHPDLDLSIASTYFKDIDYSSFSFPPSYQLIKQQQETDQEWLKKPILPELSQNYDKFKYGMMITVISYGIFITGLGLIVLYIYISLKRRLIRKLSSMSLDMQVLRTVMT